MKVVIILLILQSLHLIIHGQSGKRSECDNTEKPTCASCLEKPGCSWCSFENYTSPRCNIPLNHDTNACPKNHIINPQPEIKPVPTESSSQINPKNVSLTVRVGQPVKFRVDVIPAKNYPVDLYYLMDLSASMDDDLANLKTLANNISQTLSKLTDRHRLAFGSFVDKVVPPYVKYEKIDKPYNTGKDKPYDFKHVLDFTADGNVFQNKIGEQKSSGNRDVPEGTLDALMQVAACETMLGWNSASTTRRMVLIATDATFHMAGEGKFGGVVHPNDEECHLGDPNSNGIRFYTKSLDLDYPSVNQVYRRLLKSSMQPIFAVGQFNDGAGTAYTAIVDTWKPLGATIGKLDGASQNIIQLIKDSYHAIVSTIRFIPPTEEDIDVEIKSLTCQSTTSLSNECKDVQLGQNVSFEVSITAKSCKKNSSSFVLKATGFGDVAINIDIICSCPCQDQKEFNSTSCSGNGTLVCGRCDCNPGWSGQKCQCDPTKGSQIDSSKCKRTNDSTVFCDGNGDCDCGECRCYPIKGAGKNYYGKHCQCSDFNCEQYENQLCGGPTQGDCYCGKCTCKKGFIGTNCGDIDCSLKLKDCLDEKGTNCSNKGKCGCGKCVCDPFHYGDHCENCPSCAGRCGDFKQCVLCKVFGHVPENATLCENCETIEILKSLKEMEQLPYPEKCEFKDDDGCTFYFTYGSKDGNKVTVFAVEEKDCPEGPDVLLIILAVIGGILGIGIILLILWKLLTAMVDRREYQKFEQDRAKSKWHREKNPLYQPATSTVQNPTFVGSRT